MTVGNFLTPYFETKVESLLLTNPKFNFFSKATLRPLYIIGVPLGLSVNNNTLGTLGFSPMNVLILALVI